MATLSGIFFKGMPAIKHVYVPRSKLYDTYWQVIQFSAIYQDNSFEQIQGISLKDFVRLSRLEEFMLLNSGVFEQSISTIKEEVVSDLQLIDRFIIKLKVLSMEFKSNNLKKYFCKLGS